MLEPFNESTVRQHIDHCPTCRKSVEAFLRLDDLLRSWRSMPGAGATPAQLHDEDDSTFEGEPVMWSGSILAGLYGAIEAGRARLAVDPTHGLYQPSLLSRLIVNTGAIWQAIPTIYLSPSISAAIVAYLTAFLLPGKRRQDAKHPLEPE